MIKKLSIDLKYLIFIWGISLFAIILTWGHHGNLIVDCGREVYFPIQILKGKILYKDIFDIYGPLAYMFNAFLFKIFGINLNVLYVAGSVCTLSIISSIYLIARKFLSEFNSFALAFFTISIGIVSFNLFNFVFPYSFGMLYGLTLCLISVLLLLEYAKNTDNVKILYLAAILAGLCSICKYDFFLYGLFIIFIAFYLKKLKFVQYIILVLCLAIFPISCFAILFSKGLTFNNLLIQIYLIIRMSNAKTLHYFYSHSGVYFSKNTPMFLLRNFIKTLIPIGIFLAGIKFKNKLLGIGLIATAVCMFVLFISPKSFCFLPILAFILGMVFYKRLKEKKLIFILLMSAIIISLKVFWGLLTLNYGTFFISILLTAILAVLYDVLRDKYFDFDAFGLILIIAATILAAQNVIKMQLISTDKVSTSMGTIYTTKDIAKTSNELINYIQTNTLPDDKVVIYPEGAFINYYTGRSSEDYFLSLIPIYVEMYDERVLIKHFSETKPKYVIFNNWNTKDYFYPYICSTYAVSFCNYIDSQYNLTKTFKSNDFNYSVYKIR